MWSLYFRLVSLSMTVVQPGVRVPLGAHECVLKGSYPFNKLYTAHINDDSSHCFGFNEVYRVWLVMVIEAFGLTYKSDLEKGNNLMLMRLSPVATLFGMLQVCKIEISQCS